MKQVKRLSALLLAIGTMCSLAIPASAAINPMNLLSDHAGTTRTVQVVTADFDGNPGNEYVVNVVIPADATKAQELALIETSARQAAGMPMTRGTPTLSYTLCHTSRWALAAAGSAMVVGEAMLDRNYSVLAVTFDNVTPRNGATRINVRVGNNHYGNNSYANSELRLGSYTLVTLYADRYGQGQGGDMLRLRNQDYITVWASTDRGGADVGDVYVSANT